MVVILDYGVGNLASIKNMLKRIGVEAVVSAEDEVMQQASHIILPGVGAFDTCATQLHNSGLINSLTKKALADKTPVLGVCVGMQLLLEGSDEGKQPGLGWIKGRNVKFDSKKLTNGLKIPHMGWTDVHPAKASGIMEGLDNGSRFYFVHSYHAQLTNPTDALIWADYGYEFAAGVGRDNVIGVQFHPEKSHKFGMQLLGNFVKNYT
ncbi:MAG: imidazole glycerol phosphate synthase subunit HisH [Bacteroidetes bacterium]|nr:imidazole glycerol phosphate synthase subunit HisH [Bacteroidota bacterium]